jgi:hypothetical protein
MNLVVTGFPLILIVVWCKIEYKFSEPLGPYVEACTRFYEFSGTKNLPTAKQQDNRMKLALPLQQSSPSHCQMPPPPHQQLHHTVSLPIVLQFALSHHLWQAPGPFSNT